jgi:hypothetical protein
MPCSGLAAAPVWPPTGMLEIVLMIISFAFFVAG